MSSSRKILLTRPYADSERLAGTLLTLGLEPVISPVMDIIPTKIQMPHDLNKANSLVFTSSNAFTFLPNLPDNLYQCPVFTIGDKTFESAQKTSFRNILKAQNDSYSLAQLIKEYNPSNLKKIYHISGMDVSSKLINNFKKENIPIKQWPVYKAEKQSVLPPEIISMIKAELIGCVVLYSARTARIFEELCDFHGLKECLSQTRVLCLAPSVVKSLNAAIWGQIHTAHAACEAAILNKLTQLAEEGEI